MKWLSICLALCVSGCSLPRDHDLSQPPLALPGQLTSPAGDTVPAPAEWWHAFADERLHSHITETLRANFQLRQAWDRLRQAQAQARIAGADGRLAAELGGGASLTRTVDRDPALPALSSDDTEDRYFVNLGLSYEADLWGRIAANRDGAVLRAAATREDAEATALLLTGSAADLYFTILEQSALIGLVEEQIATNQQFVDLTELRFSLGEGSAVDVLQQRQQVAATRSQLPTVRATLETAQLQLAVLQGRAPQRASAVVGQLPPLPPLPQLPTPEALIHARPELRAALFRLEAADEDLAAAVAARLPRLTFGLSYDVSATDLGRLFEREVGSLIGNLVGPLIDGGRRKSEIRRREAALQEQLNGLCQAFLDALLEFEQLIARDRYQGELRARLDEELALARQTVDESRSRYANGTDTYLSVLTALQRTQVLERRRVSEERTALAIRAQMYRALGGREWTAQLSPQPQHDLKAVEEKRR